MGLADSPGGKYAGVAGGILVDQEHVVIYQVQVQEEGEVQL